MKVLVCGSRGWTRKDLIFDQLQLLEGEVIVIHGAARGADTHAGEVAEELNFDVFACPADWKRYGRAAGIIRNRQMLDDYQPELVLAFVRNWGRSPGSRHTVDLALQRGLDVRVFDEAGPLEVEL
ncbi:MAG: DUF2493 domain-containing protein [Planctomycetaceae bacterium]|nr:DUF2493 domain-containing protein [Planctomycetaceae bacterium]